MKYKERKNRKLRKNIALVGIVLLTFVAMMLILNIYEEIDVEQEISTQSATGNNAIRTGQTVEMAKSENETVSDVIEKVTESVVGISKIKNVGNSIFSKDGTTELGLGTGVIISEDGYIMTNEHVSGSRYDTCYITLEDGRSFTGNVIWSDSDLDLSIVKIKAKQLPFMTLADSDQIRVGENVYAIGNPIGFEFQRTVTSGIVSAINRTIKIEENEKSFYMEDLIQTDATINPGNSGGPLITVDGKMIGINSVKIASAEGIGFAIPINIVKPIIEKINQTGSFEEAYIGIFGYDKEVIPYLNSNLKLDHGVYIAQIDLEGPCSKAGLKIGDIITAIDGKEIDKMTTLRNYIYTKNPNDEVTLKVFRNNKEKEVKIVLGKKT